MEEHNKDCQKCKGYGYFYALLKDRGSLNYSQHNIPCDALKAEDFYKHFKH